MGLMLLVAWVAPARAQDAPRPDILLLMPDQWRGDALSARAHPIVKTPVVDRLASQGTLFRRAYATVPSCIPARHSLLTGLFPQTSGVVGFKARRITVPTLPRVLAEAGYATVLVGRNMHQFPPSDALGFQQRIRGSTYIDDDEYDRALRAAAPGSGGIRALVGSLGLTFNHWQAKAWPLAVELHPTNWVADQARKIVDETPREKPLFLCTSFYAPHSPLFPPATQFDALLEAELPPPARGDWVDWEALTQAGDRNGHRVLLEGDTLHRAQAGYFGLIQHLDATVAPLIAAFRARSEAAGRPWLVVFTADHGELLGDHGYYRKCEPYEGSANIPFVIAGAESLGFAAGLRSDEPVCLEDLMPTLVELAGAELPQPVDGISLVHVLRGESDDVRDRLHGEHAPCYGTAQAFHLLTDGRFKYIWRPLDGSEQLFDLSTDPREEHDLARLAESRELVAHWRDFMIEQLRDRPEGFSDGTELIAGRPYPPLQAERK